MPRHRLRLELGRLAGDVRLRSGLARLAGLGEREQRGRSPELGRAFANLGRVLANRFREGGLDSTTIEQIVDIVDEAAKRIERL